MAGDSKKLQPIIVKKIKKGGHGHHGGAWKIAYADFVTAMMAFFLLMWLLGSTTEKQRKALADYFAPTLVPSSVVIGMTSLVAELIMTSSAERNSASVMSRSSKGMPASRASSSMSP